MSTSPHATDPGERTAFFRQLQQLTTRIHATRHIDEIMLDLSGAVCSLFGADRLTIYILGEDKASMVSKVKTGLASFSQLKLPISAQSVAGYAALSRTLVNLRDVYDADELKAHAPELKFQQGVDKRTGYRTTQMLAAPIVHADEVIGVVQLINNQRARAAFSDTVVEGTRYLCETLAIAFAQRQQAPRLERERFVASIRDTLLGRAELEQAAQLAAAAGRDIEDVLLDDFKLKTGAVGRALADYFAVPYLAFHPQRRKPLELLTAIDRAFAAEGQWLPIEANPNGLYVLCTDPEKVKAGGSVARLFPSARAVYCVTTRREFNAMLEHCFGPAPQAAALPAGRQQELVNAVTALVAGSHQQGLSDLKIETAPGAHPGEIRFTVSGVLKLP